MDEDTILKERKDKVFSYFKNKFDWLIYVGLAIIVFIAVKIRTLNLPRLRDSTTGGWTLGPDLDPFLFLRWAKYIVENGSLYAIDSMRYVPLGFKTRGELILHPYMIAWFHNIASIFGSSSVEQSAALYPVFFFAITVIAFFFLVKQIFLKGEDANKVGIIALVSSLILVVAPVLLPRTIAGIPEKESAGFFFLFAAFFFFLLGWESKTKKKIFVSSIVAGIMTAGMALVWGGFFYIFIVISITTLAAFLLGKVRSNQIYGYGGWLVSATIFMTLFSTRYPVMGLISLTTTGPSYFVLFLLIFAMILNHFKDSKYVQKLNRIKLPRNLSILVVFTILALIISMVVFGPGFLVHKVSDVKNNLIKPVTDRLGVTVAENRQPYFGEWAGNFGPDFAGIPVMFGIFFMGSIYLFYQMLKLFPKKEKIIMTCGYVVFLFAIVFSRYKSGSLLNGENFASISLYIIGFLVLVLTLLYYYIKHDKQGDLGKFKKIDYGKIFLFAFFFFSIVSARGAVRLIMVLIPSAAIIASYFVVDVAFKARRKEGGKNVAMLIVAAVLVIFLAYSTFAFYQVSSGTARNYVPSVYNQQWQEAMSWVRENTDESAVFGHWWDYGYWIQSIGERATVLDGGNVYIYWNYLMGRHVLTSKDDKVGLEYLYSHDATHLLIDSTDIGKYTAFSSIGSNEEYDRRSWIPTFLKDDSSTEEKKNSIVTYYAGSTSLDEDIIYVGENEKKMFLAGVGDSDLDKVGSIAGLGAIKLEKSKNGTGIGVTGLYVYQGVPYEIPIRYVYYAGTLIDTGRGLEAGVFIYPAVTSSTSLDSEGAAIYLSKRTFNSNIAKLYLLGLDDNYFKLEHTEDDFIVESLKQQGITQSDFVYYNGLRGPIKIWSIDYPDDISKRDEYLSKTFPGENPLLK
ncbi:hypothetical protein CO081_01060 [Candidatus Pacearchaeota archaeon CG_4_9_14_0_8_um_filter_35_24]|nr:MAG: hypothetical protein CO081_01060 [Candidatus Pacearchaeota archaeon CG_4_9_14_0_8_um_filter_35_24]